MFESLQKRRESFWRELGATTLTHAPAADSVVTGNALSESSSNDTKFGSQPTLAPSNMNEPLRIAVATLHHDISRNLPSDHSMALELTELLFTGLALLHGFSMLWIGTFVPGMSALKFRVRVSKALSDPDTSAWYFETLDAFSGRFLDLWKSHGNPSTDIFGLRHQDDLRAVETTCLRHLPMMPVCQGA